MLTVASSLGIHPRSIVAERAPAFYFQISKIVIPTMVISDCEYFSRGVLNSTYAMDLSGAWALIASHTEGVSSKLIFCCQYFPFICTVLPLI